MHFGVAICNSFNEIQTKHPHKNMQQETLSYNTQNLATSGG